MKWMLSSLAACALLLGGMTAHAQQTVKKETKQQDPPAPVTAPLSVGTAFNASLLTPLDTRKARPGDPVMAEASEDVKYESCVIFPKGTQIVGHVVRASSARGHARPSALFIQFDKAILKDSQEVILDAGIQALAVGSVAPQADLNSKVADADLTADTPGSESASPVTESGSTENATVLSTIYDTPKTLRLPTELPPSPAGQVDSNGLFSPDSTGAWGQPDLKIYTPTSDGSHGTVLLSSKKNIHLINGTRLLLVVQPPPATDTEVPDGNLPPAIEE